MKVWNVRQSVGCVFLPVGIEIRDAWWKFDSCWSEWEKDALLRIGDGPFGGQHEGWDGVEAWVLEA